MALLLQITTSLLEIAKLLEITTIITNHGKKGAPGNEVGRKWKVLTVNCKQAGKLIYFFSLWFKDGCGWLQYDQRSFRG